MEYKSPYLCWQGVISKQSYAIHRWDDALPKNLTAEEPLAATWPAKIVCMVDAVNPPIKPVLADHLLNAEDLLVISQRLRTFLEKAAVPDVEYLPIQLIDPTGLRVSDTYSIVHTLNSPDCLDMKASGAKRSRVIPSKAEKLLRVVLKNDPGRPLFRPLTFGKITLISWELAEAIADHGFTGFRFMGLFDYGHTGDLAPHVKRPPIDVLCTQLWKNGLKVPGSPG